MIYCSREVSIWVKSGLLALLLCRWPEDKNMGSALMLIEGFLLPASMQAQVIVKGIHRNETATIKTVRKKPFRHRCD